MGFQGRRRQLGIVDHQGDQDALFVWQAVAPHSPLDAQDAQVTDGKCDTGAVEYTPTATAPTATSAPAGK